MLTTAGANAAIEADLDDAADDESGRLSAALADREARIRALEDEAIRLTADFSLLLHDRAIVRAARSLSRTVDRLAPAGTRRRRTLRQLGRQAIEVAERRRRHRARVTTAEAAVERDAVEGARYSAWLKLHEPDGEGLGRMRKEDSRWKYRPLVSVIVPVYNARQSWLDQLVASLLDQAYEHWELCLADDHSPAEWVRPTLERLAAAEPRVKVVFRGTNGGIAVASNSALDMATGEFVALLDHDDVLLPHALHEVVASLQEEADLDILYSDEDKVMVDGSRGEASFKASFDPDYLLSTNYVCHLTVVRRTVMTAIGGFRTGLDGSQDHDLIIRATEATTRVRHIPSVLYSWRQVRGSAALSVEYKPRAWEAGRRAVADALARRGIDGRVELGAGPGLYDVRLDMPHSARVALILHGCSAATVPGTIADLLAGAGLSPVQVLVTGQDPQLVTLRNTGADVLVGAVPERRAMLLNMALARVDADVVVFVRGDSAPKRSVVGWMTPLVEQALRPEVGVAGGRLVNGSYQAVQEGLRLGRGPIPVSLGVRFPVIQRVAAVSAGLMAVRVRELRESGGFDERLWRDLWDVDLCLRLRQRGLAVVYTPLAELVQHGGGALNSWVAPDDLEAFTRVWGPVDELDDPYMPPNLDSISPLVIRLPHQPPEGANPPSPRQEQVERVAGRLPAG